MSETLRHTEAWAKMLRNGITIWRSVYFENGQPMPETTTFDATDRGSFLGRIQLVGNPGCWEPCVLSNSYTTPSGQQGYTKGIAMFLDTHPPVNWTHLILCGVSHVFKTPGRQGSGGCVFAKVASPYSMESYLDFRKRLFDLYQQTPQADIEQAIQSSRGVWINSPQLHPRLIVKNAWTPEADFHFGIITQQKPTS